ncbi:MAG: hypothetical protein ACRC0L_05150, partial [Angustibacter sp.]
MASDLRESMESWRTIALTLDHFPLALALCETSDEDDPRAAALARAELLIFCDRWTEARHLLAEHGLDEVPDHTPNSRVALVATALAAATGDDRCYSRLLSLGPMNDWLPGYLLGVVAEARADWQIADQAWLDCGGRMQIMTRFSFPRWASAQAKNRDPGSGQLTSLCQIAHGALQLPHPLGVDPGPAEAAVLRLIHQEDQAGAALLARSFYANHPDLPRNSLPEAPGPRLSWRERWTHWRLGHPDCPQKRALSTVSDAWLLSTAWALALLLGLGIGRLPGGGVGLGTALVAVGALAILVALGRKLQSMQHHRRLARRQRDYLREAAECRCARAQYFSEAVARRYASEHLEPSSLGPSRILTDLSDNGFSGAVLRCPD